MTQPDKEEASQTQPSGPQTGVYLGIWSLLIMDCKHTVVCMQPIMSVLIQPKDNILCVSLLQMVLLDSELPVFTGSAAIAYSIRHPDFGWLTGAAQSVAMGSVSALPSWQI